MDDSDYGMESEDSSPSQAQQGNDTPKEGDDSGPEGMALIPLDVCPDCQPGDTLTFKVDKVLDKEISIRYVKTSSEKEPDAGDTEEASEPDEMEMT